jgi:hypothetical protein
VGLNPQADRHLVLVRGRDIEMQINHAAGSAHQLDGGARQLLCSLLERQSCGVAAGDAPEQVLQEVLIQQVSLVPKLSEQEQVLRLETL